VYGKKNKNGTSFKQRIPVDVLPMDLGGQADMRLLSDAAKVSRRRQAALSAW
jgi:hypothetical protein